MSEAESMTRSDQTRARILKAARDLFGSHGYERTTIRKVAAAAQIHPSMVMRYYNSKEGLFAAAASFNLRLPDLKEVPRQRVGELLVRHALDIWENDADGRNIPLLLRAAITNQQALQRAQAVFKEQVAPAVQAVCSGRQANTRAALVATQMLGLAYARYVLRLPEVLALAPDLLIARVGKTIQSYIADDE